MALPSDILRVHVLPFLLWEERLDANSVLEKDAKLVQKMATVDKATAMAVRTLHSLMDDCEFATTEKRKVKTTTRVFVFLQHPLGRFILDKQPGPAARQIASIIARKITELSEEKPPTWWKRSPLRKRLKLEMERVAEILRTR